MEKTLNLHSQFGGDYAVSLEINTYLNNGCLYIGLVEQGEYPEPYGDLTVNFDGKAPDYCGYVDINNMKKEFFSKKEEKTFCEETENFTD